MKIATMTAALSGHTNTTANGQPAEPALSLTGPIEAGAAYPARQTLDRWPFSLNFRVVIPARPVVEREA